MKKLSGAIVALTLAGATNIAAAEEVMYDFSAPPFLIEGVHSDIGSAQLGEVFIYENLGVEVRVVSRGTYSLGSPNAVSFTDALGIGVFSYHNDQWLNETPYFENFLDGSSNNITLDFSLPVRLDSVSLGYVGSDSDLQIRYRAESGGIGRTDVTSDLPLGETEVNGQGIYSNRWIIDPVPLNWDTSGLYPTTDGIVESVLISGITVDVEELPPAGGDAPELDQLVYSIAENNFPAAFLDWSDPNGDDVTVSIVGGDDAGLFDYYADDQKLVFFAAPDFENPHDFDRDNNYEVLMSATDGTHTAEYPVTIEVAPVNEAPEQSCCIVWSLSLGDSVVGEVVAVDPENDPVSYMLLGGDADLFQISSSGLLSLRDPSTTEITYSFTLRISDGINIVDETNYVHVVQE